MTLLNRSVIISALLLSCYSVEIVSGENKQGTCQKSSMLIMAKDSAIRALKVTSPIALLNHAYTVSQSKTGVNVKSFFNAKNIYKSAKRTAPFAFLAAYYDWMNRRSQLD